MKTAMPEEELSTWFSNVVPTALKKQAKKKRRQSTKRIQRRRQCAWTPDTFSTSSSNAHCTPSLVLALASMNSMWCLRANFKPSSFDTSRFSCTSTIPYDNQVSCLHIPQTYECDLGCRRKGGGGSFAFQRSFFVLKRYYYMMNTSVHCY